MKRRYVVTLEAEVEIDDEIVATAMTEEWASQFYTFRSREEVVEHVARNLLTLGGSLDQLDGFADQSADGATVDEVTAIGCEEVSTGAATGATGRAGA